MTAAMYVLGTLTLVAVLLAIYALLYEWVRSVFGAWWAASSFRGIRVLRPGEVVPIKDAEPAPYGTDPW